MTSNSTSSSELASRTISRPMTTIRRRLLSRLLVFFFLEIAFIALGIACLSNELPCSLFSSPTLTKAIFTVLFIAWHAVAIMCAQEIVFQSFSSEWYFLLQKQGKLVPGYTDMVSTITSGFRNRFLHFFGRSTSFAYRLSYIASWVLFALSGIGPGSINVDDVPRFSRTTINITNFTFTGGDTDGILKDPIVRAGHVVELELRESTPFKFATEEHVVVGWPQVEAGKMTGDMEFPSDALFYNMTCWWEAPSFNMSQWNTTWYAGGFAWYPWTTPDPDTFYDGGLMSMFRFSTNQDFTPDNFPIPTPAVEPIGLSGYLFFGRNSSFPDKPSEKRTLSLDNLPTIFNDSGFHFIDFDGADGHFKSPLASFLLCDPTARVFDGQVRFSRTNTAITLQSTTPTNFGKANVGNISPDAANVVLGLSLLGALDAEDTDVRIFIGEIASQTFINDTSLDFSRNGSNSFDVGLLPLQEIQNNLNQLMRSSSKALSANLNTQNAVAQEHTLLPVTGAIQKGEQVLTASRDFLIAIICLVFTAVLAMVLNVLLFSVWSTPAFTLESLFQTSDETQIKTGLKTPHISPPYISPYPDTVRSATKNRLLRLVGFVLLEVAFFFLVLVCSRTPLVVNVPLLPLSSVKGAFTVLFIIWHGLATFLLLDAVSFAYSCEWSLQRRRASLFIREEADRVSRLTSGNLDKMRYFFTGRSSATFRIAFAAFIAFASLNSFAPGTLSLGQITTQVNTTLNIADLSLLTSSQDDDNDNNSDFLQSRADAVTLLEHHEGFNFRYEVPPNWVMAWPDETTINSYIVGMVEYPTDVIHFNYSCAWEVPEIGGLNGTTAWYLDGQPEAWQLWSDPLPNFSYTGGFLPLYRYIDIQPDGRLAVLALGTNSSLPVDPDEDKRSFLNLDNLPTLYHPSGINLNDSDGDPSQWTSPLSTILYCDPQLQVSGGRAQLSPDKSLTLAASGLSRIGNIPDEAVTTLFASALLLTLDTADETDKPWVGAQSIDMFLPVTSDDDFSKYPSGVPLHNITTINSKFNDYTLSASKAFADGLYANPHNQSDLTPQTRLVAGIGEVQRQGLASDKRLGILSLCLSVACAILYGLLVRWLAVHGGEPFELASLLPVISAEKEESFMPLD
ncbi:hypothetical protein D9756_005726 [Leucocoprinus leucothites]|uniref:Transmembrane protein n=1 Tax=Leucocoprinus leucothites TaxID=201217 RepID=A0A8H5D8X0_9AGAR|nr:hypothetical protein D9756_005726 [Leucoagaricus leucothites]